MTKSFTIPSLKVTYACRYYVFHALQAVVIAILELDIRTLRLIFVIYRYMTSLGLPQWLNSKESTCNAGDAGDMGSMSGWFNVSIPWRRAWQPTPVFLPEESHGQRSLVGYSPQGHEELDMIEVTEHSMWHHYFLVNICKVAFKWNNNNKKEHWGSERLGRLSKTQQLGGAEMN